MSSLRFSLAPLPPFRLDLTAWALRRRPINQMDSWDGETYSRVLAQGDRPILMEVRQNGGASAPRLEVTATSEGRTPPSHALVTQALNRLLGLRLDLGPFYRFAETDPRLAPLTRRYQGFKPPRFPSVFEAILNGIACQQLTLHVGLTLLDRLCTKSGLPFETKTGVRYSFPNSESLRLLPVRTFRALGFSQNKAKAIRTLSTEIHQKAFDPESLVQLDNDQAISRLLELRGIGRWTAEYVLLRGLGRTDLFPGDDIGARNNLRRWLHLHHDLDYMSVQKTLSRWRPYAGLLYFHLLLDSLNSSGQLTGELGAATAA